MQEFEAAFYEKIEKGSVRCLLCPHTCVIREGKSGICGARKNSGGTLVTEIYGRLTAVAMDPIEKKPLYHFHPGTRILSIGTRGCNMKCPYCQNWHISQDLSARTDYYSPDDIIAMAEREGSIGIAYTYSEPMIWYEYVRDTARIAKMRGLKNVLVTNGFISREPLEELLTCVDAMNIDLKSFREDTYRKIQKAGLAGVLESIKISKRAGCHIELTTLIVTGINDDMGEMDDATDFIASVDRNIPWHLSRYHPSYKYDRSATDINFMTAVHDRAVKKLNFVYCGNMPYGCGGNDTVCPSCKTTVISRSGYATRIVNLRGSACGSCGNDLGIIT